MKILKFLHASDFQLHLPVTCWSSNETEVISDHPCGHPFHLSPSTHNFWTESALPTDLPTELREECLGATWRSAENVFDLAIEQSVDFVLLSGNMILPDLTGARGMVFLTEQFRRLQHQGIPVYWRLERSIEDWILPDFHFPENVFIFPSSEDHIKKFRLPESPKNIFIASWNTVSADFSCYDFTNLTEQKLPPSQTIALCPDENVFCNTKASALQGVAYVALTGVKERFTRKLEQVKDAPATIMHAPGTIQHKSHSEFSQNHDMPIAGVTVVQLDLDGEMPTSLQFFATETIGWRFLDVKLPADVQSWETLRRWMLETLKNEFPIKEDTNTGGTPKNDLRNRIFVFWNLTSENSAQCKLLRSIFQENMEVSCGLATDNLAFLLEKLRTVGEELPEKPWSVAISVGRAGLVPVSWYQAETMLGDFLRLEQFHLGEQNDEAQSPDFAVHNLDLRTVLSDEQCQNGLETLGMLHAEERKVLLEMAAVLGAEALAGVQEERKK